MEARRLFRTVGFAALALGALSLFALPSRTTREVSGRKYPNRIPVRFWHMWSAEWKDVVDKIVDRYNRSQDRYEVIALSVPGSADTKFLLGAMGGDPPDVMAQWNPVIPTWAEAKMLTPFEELMTPDEHARFEREAYPIVKRVGLYKGQTYGIPIGINANAIYYLPKALAEGGYREIPKTWEGLLEMGERLSKRDKNGTLTRLGFLPGDWRGTMPLFGGGLFDFQRHELTLDRPENLRCLESLVGYRKRLGYEDVKRFQAGLNTDSFAGGWPFIGEAYAAVVDGQWRVEQLAKYAPKLEYRTAPIPAPVGGVPEAGSGGGNFMIVPRSAKEKQGAWDFVKFWSGIDHPERAAEFYCWGGWLPLSEKVAQSPIYRAYIRKYPQFQTFVDAVRSPDLRANPPVAYQVFITDMVQKVEDLALRGSITPKEAVRRLKASVDHEAERRKELGYDE